jgi:hypothetical protein
LACTSLIKNNKQKNGFFFVPFEYFAYFCTIKPFRHYSYGYYFITSSWMFGWLLRRQVDERWRLRPHHELYTGSLRWGWLFDLLGVSWGGLLGQLGTAIIGAVVILWIASLIKK